MIAPAIRLHIDTENPSGNFVDLFTGKAAQIYRGGRTAVQVSFFNKNFLITDWTGISKIGMGIMDSYDASGTFILNPIYAAFNPLTSVDGWIAATEAHAAFSITPLNSQLAEGLRRMVFFAEDSDGVRIPLGSAPVNIVVSGMGTNYQPTQMQAPDLLWYWTRLVFGDDGLPTLEIGTIPAAAPSGPSSYTQGNPLKIKAPDGLWYAITLVMGDDGKPTFAVASTGTTN